MTLIAVKPSYSITISGLKVNDKTYVYTADIIDRRDCPAGCIDIYKYYLSHDSIHYPIPFVRSLMSGEITEDMSIIGHNLNIPKRQLDALTGTLYNFRPIELIQVDSCFGWRCYFHNDTFKYYYIVPDPKRNGYFIPVNDSMVLNGAIIKYVIKSRFSHKFNSAPDDSNSTYPYWSFDNFTIDGIKVIYNPMTTNDSNLIRNQPQK
jgi:hypothetical protein